MRSVFQTKPVIRPNAAVLALAPLLMAVTAVIAVAFAGCDSASSGSTTPPAVTVTGVNAEALQNAAVADSADGTVINIGAGDSVIALILDNPRGIPLELSLGTSITGGAGIKWAVALNDAGEAVVTISGAAPNDEVNLTLRIGSGGRDFAPYTFTVRCTAVDPDPDPAFTVTFDTQGQGSVPSKTVTVGNTLSYPEPPDYPGYYLEGWFTDSVFTDETRWSFVNDTVTADTALYAKWTAIDTAVTYTVTFVNPSPGTGAPPAPQTVLKGSTAVEPVPPTEPGWDFGGWYKEDTCTTQWLFNGDDVTSDTTLFANWTPVTPITYTVTFVNPSPGTGAPPLPQDVTGGGPVTPEADLIEEGYTFGGWYKDAACDYRWDFAADIVTGDMDLYAKWTPITYTVTFDFGISRETQTVRHGNTASYPVTPVRDGMDIEGWYEDSGFSVPWIFAAPVTRNVNLCAKWLSYNEIDFGLVGSATVRTVGSEAQWKTAIDAINADSGKNHIINLTADFLLTGFAPGNPIIEAANSKISIRGNHTITLRDEGSLLAIDRNTVSVTLRGPTLKGKDGVEFPVVGAMRGTFYFRSGTIGGSTNGVHVEGNFIMSGGTISGKAALIPSAAG